MATNDNITLAKGSYSITLFTITPTENWKNTLEVIPGVTTVDNQVNAPNKAQVVDLQRTTRSFVFECAITATTGPTKTAKQIKDELRILFEGARIGGGTITLTYEGVTYGVFFEDCVLKKAANDDTVTNYSGDDALEYTATITLVEGEQV